MRDNSKTKLRRLLRKVKSDQLNEQLHTAFCKLGSKELAPAYRLIQDSTKLNAFIKPVRRGHITSKAPFEYNRVAGSRIFFANKDDIIFVEVKTNRVKLVQPTPLGEAVDGIAAKVLREVRRLT